MDEFELCFQDGELDEDVFLLTVQVGLPVLERPGNAFRCRRDEDRVLDMRVPADEVLDRADAPRFPVHTPAVGQEDAVQVADEGDIQPPVFNAPPLC